MEMTKKELDWHIEALVGPAAVEKWWNCPNKKWNGLTPIVVYEKDENGKKEVEEYILMYCYGR